MDERTTSARQELYFLLAVTAIHILFRVIYIWQYQGSEYWGHLTVDARFHYLWAQAIASGDFWGTEVFFRAPFYAYFLALLQIIFSGSILGIVIAQNVIGIISFLLIYKLCKEIFGLRPAQIAAVLYIFTFNFYFFESELLLDFLLVFFLPLFFLTVIRAEKTDNFLFWLLGGVILGLAAATRPTVLILAVIVPLFFLRPSSKLFSLINWIKRSAIYLAGLIAVLLPIAIRNQVVGGQFTALPTQGGINFYIGNNQQANGWSAAMPDSLGGAFWQYAECKQIAEQARGRELNPSEVSRFWYGKGLEELADQPGQALQLYLKKITLLFTNDDISNNRNIPQYKESISISGILQISWWLLFPFGLVGIITGLKNNYKAKLTALFILFYSLAVLIFFVTSRFRLPLLPFWIIFASYGIYYMLWLISEKKIRSIILYSLLIVAAAAFSLISFYKTDFSNPLQEKYIRGNRQLEEGNLERAREIYRDLLKTNPQYLQANMNLAASFVKSGQLDSAEYYYERELEVNPNSARSLSSLAEISRLRGNYLQSYNHAERALDLKPFFTEVMINYVKSARAASRQDTAHERINAIENEYKENPYYYFYRGVLKIDLASTNLEFLSGSEDDFIMALDLFEKVSQPSYDRDPALHTLLFSFEKKEEMMALAWANIGVINLNKSENSRALEAFEIALSLDSTLDQARRGLLEALMRTGDFERALKLSDELMPQSEGIEMRTFMLYKAQALYNLGRNAEAVETLEELLVLYPEFETARRILEAIKTGG
ncbi:MAG: tetratricopeptide repeat protein [candidate division Zixibacteria bacterium]|nr:tetratricopeptide repeat protein [candidate division Zixibacteria bacterium]NIR64162.1 tetratricopeptide repeat protein [candidate division Zixibacteria bacterium]NIS15591.1 tetratricopeptide repeat protein [candidate division Zixibacteria bacterium]NIS46059.1 tetratricopeptide repeat protein [candidate division Zixibacteria bacterium]NIT52109.1 tetratricopeptide repeat protein [candidate division Zixibacteria bacterium]